MQSIRRTVVVCALGVTILASSGIVPQVAGASVMYGHFRSWSPRGNARTSGTTRISFSQETDLPSQVGPFRFYASNKRTVFKRQAKRLSRNRFFAFVRTLPADNRGAEIHWRWLKRHNGTRYRYAYRVITYF